MDRAAAGLSSIVFVEARAHAHAHGEKKVSKGTMSCAVSCRELQMQIVL
jgi:hypothetical protein